MTRDVYNKKLNSKKRHCSTLQQRKNRRITIKENPEILFPTRKIPLTAVFVIFWCRQFCQNDEGRNGNDGTLRFSPTLFLSGFLRHFETEAMLALWELTPTQAKKSTILFAETPSGQHKSWIMKIHVLSNAIIPDDHGSSTIINNINGFDAIRADAVRFTRPVDLTICGLSGTTFRQQLCPVPAVSQGMSRQAGTLPHR